MKNKLAYLATIICSLTILSLNPFPVTAAEVVTPDFGAIMTTEADLIDWRYKIEDGKMYKRLYNYTKQVWVGEWILVG